VFRLKQQDFQMAISAGSYGTQLQMLVKAVKVLFFGIASSPNFFTMAPNPRCFFSLYSCFFTQQCLRPSSSSDILLLPFQVRSNHASANWFRLQIVTTNFVSQDSKGADSTRTSFFQHTASSTLVYSTHLAQSESRTMPRAVSSRTRRSDRGSKFSKFKGCLSTSRHAALRLVLYLFVWHVLYVTTHVMYPMSTSHVLKGCVIAMPTAG
jgi:hypothetical protein